MIARILLACAILLGFSGCISQRGISLQYYDDCDEYYDALGIYHKDCPKMLYEFTDDEAKNKP